MLIVFRVIDEYVLSVEISWTLNHVIFDVLMVEISAVLLVLLIKNTWLSGNNTLLLSFYTCIFLFGWRPRWDNVCSVAGPTENRTPRAPPESSLEGVLTSFASLWNRESMWENRITKTKQKKPQMYSLHVSFGDRSIEEATHKSAEIAGQSWLGSTQLQAGVLQGLGNHP